MMRVFISIEDSIKDGVNYIWCKEIVFSNEIVSSLIDNFNILY